MKKYKVTLLYQLGGEHIFTIVADDKACAVIKAMLNSKIASKNTYADKTIKDFSVEWLGTAK